VLVAQLGDRAAALRLVIRGELEPTVLINQRNSASCATQPGEDGDVRIPPRSLSQRRR
jgi:hypothetical protein